MIRKIVSLGGLNKSLRDNPNEPARTNVADALEHGDDDAEVAVGDASFDLPGAFGLNRQVILDGCRCLFPFVEDVLSVEVGVLLGGLEQLRRSGRAACRRSAVSLPISNSRFAATSARSVGLSLIGHDCCPRWDTLPQRAVPDQHVRTQVRPVRPDDGTVLNPRGLEERAITANRFEHRPDEQPLDVPLNY